VDSQISELAPRSGFREVRVSRSADVVALQPLPGGKSPDETHTDENKVSTLKDLRTAANIVMPRCTFTRVHNAPIATQREGTQISRDPCHASMDSAL
jgi:hypothetical protein